MRFCAISKVYPKDIPGGAEYQAYLICRELARRGWETHYVATSAGENSTEMDDNIVVHRLDGGYKSAISTIMGVDADFHYFNLLAQMPLSTLIQRRTGTPSLYHVSSDAVCLPRFSNWPGEEFSSVYRQFKYQLQLAFWRSLIHRQAFVFTQKREQADLLEKNHGVKSRILRTGQPIPPRPFEKADPPIVLWLATLKPLKQPERFVDLAEQCKDLDCRFWLVGRPINSEIESRILDRVELLDNLTYKGGCDIHESNQYFQKASVFVNTSVLEGLPNTFIQSWLRETPVVSLQADVEDQLGQGTGGCLAKTQEKLVECTQRLMEDESLRQSIGRDARKMARDNFDIQQVVDTIESVMENNVRDSSSGHVR